MTQPTLPVSQEAREASPFERWPGYDEQSWQQRFLELDRRYAELQQTSPAAFQRAMTAASCFERRINDAKIPAWLEELP